MTASRAKEPGAAEVQEWLPSKTDLFRLFVCGMLAATIAKLRELEPTRGRLLVLRRRVIPLLALSALQRHNFPHFKSFEKQLSVLWSQFSGTAFSNP